MEVVFTKTYLNHILSKYLYLCTMACNNYYLISFPCTLLYKNFNFRIHGHCKITCKNDLYSCEYHEKIFWLKFRIHAKFRARKFIYFEWMRNFVQNWFRIDTKMMRNFAQKSYFVQNHATVAQENWLFRGNPTIRIPIKFTKFNLEIAFIFVINEITKKMFL